MFFSQRGAKALSSWSSSLPRTLPCSLCHPLRLSIKDRYGERESRLKLRLDDGGSCGGWGRRTTAAAAAAILVLVVVLLALSDVSVLQGYHNGFASTYSGHLSPLLAVLLLVGLLVLFLIVLIVVALVPSISWERLASVRCESSPSYRPGRAGWGPGLDIEHRGNREPQPAPAVEARRTGSSAWCRHAASRLVQSVSRPALSTWVIKRMEESQHTWGARGRGGCNSGGSGRDRRGGGGGVGGLLLSRKHGQQAISDRRILPTRDIYVHGKRIPWECDVELTLLDILCQIRGQSFVAMLESRSMEAITYERSLMFFLI